MVQNCSTQLLKSHPLLHSFADSLSFYDVFPDCHSVHAEMGHLQGSTRDEQGELNLKILSPPQPTLTTLKESN